jgi:hypothetical protein
MSKKISMDVLAQHEKPFTWLQNAGRQAAIHP